MNITTRRTAARRTGRIATAVALAAAGLTMTAGSASAANSGSVMCVNQANVVGVWVTVSGGTSGWAARSGSGYSQRWSYNTQGKSYKLTVGCGGSPSNWASSSSTPTFSTNWSNVNCYPGWVYGGASYSVHDKCF